jgi:hypothetical protein
MIRFQIVERPGADLYRTLLAAMRSGDLRTFYTEKRGRRVLHRSPSTPGWMSWSAHDGVILCEILSPQKAGAEWNLFHAFVGRLADRFADRIHSIQIQFPDAPPFAPAKRRRRKARRR